MSDILSVLAGAAIGVIGCFVGRFFLRRAKKAAKKRAEELTKLKKLEELKLKNLEELMGAVAEHYHWIAAMRYFTISGHGNQPALSPITKIQAIVGMYFPEFDALALQFDTVSNDYELWILDMGQRRVRNEPGLAGHDDVMPPYIAKRTEFLSALRNFARREFQLHTTAHN